MKYEDMHGLREAWGQIGKAIYCSTEDIAVNYQDKQLLSGVLTSEVGLGRIY